MLRGTFFSVRQEVEVSLGEADVSDVSELAHDPVKSEGVHEDGRSVGCLPFPDRWL